MMVYNCIVVDVGSSFLEFRYWLVLVYVFRQIMIVNELIRRPVLVAYWLLNLIGAN